MFKWTPKSVRSKSNLFHCQILTTNIGRNSYSNSNLFVRKKFTTLVESGIAQCWCCLSWVIIWLLKRVSCFPSFLIGWNHSCSVQGKRDVFSANHARVKPDVNSSGFSRSWHQFMFLLRFVDRRQSLENLFILEQTTWTLLCNVEIVYLMKKKDSTTRSVRFTSHNARKITETQQIM